MTPDDARRKEELEQAVREIMGGPQTEMGKERAATFWSVVAKDMLERNRVKYIARAATAPIYFGKQS